VTIAEGAIQTRVEAPRVSVEPATVHVPVTIAEGAIAVTQPAITVQAAARRVIKTIQRNAAGAITGITESES